MDQIFGLGILLFFSAFFSGTETALCALSKVQIERLRSETKKNSVAIINFVDNPRRLFITILLGNTFINTAFATISAKLIGTDGVMFVIGTATITTLLLLFGEITPKTYAIKYAEKFANLTARPLWFFSIMISPIRTILRGITNLLIPIFGGHNIPKEDLITAADFKAIVSSENPLGSDARDLLTKIVDLSDIDAKEIMVPRTDAIFAEISTPIREVIDLSRRVGFSRIPIYEKQVDRIRGVFHVKDLVQWTQSKIRNLTIDKFLENHDPNDTQYPLIRPAFFVFENRKITDLLKELTDAKTKLAILIDEYGGVSGLVSVEDILEEIVGEIVDEHDTSISPPEIIVGEDPSIIHVFGRVTTRQLNQRFDLKIDETIADTISGYAFHLFGRIPTIGEIAIDENGTKFEIAEMDENSIETITIRLTINAHS